MSTVTFPGAAVIVQHSASETLALYVSLGLLTAFGVACITLGIYGTVRQWSPRKVGVVGVPIMLFTLVALSILLRTPWWLALPSFVIAPLAVIGWIASIPRIREAFLALTRRKDTAQTQRNTGAEVRNDGRRRTHD